MPLQLKIGSTSEAGRRESNEDFLGVVTPTGAQLATKGAVLAIADGVSGNGGGREAAENTVRSILADYYATPETWEIPHALDKVAGSINRWLLAQSTLHRELAGMACTLSLLVLRGGRYTLAHVGDTRIYRQRGERLEQLTTDHVWDRPDMQHVLKRAVGLDQHLVLDFAEGEVQEGDVFMLVSDGVWEILGDKSMHELLNLHRDPQRAAAALVAKALAQNGQDNATALVVKVEKLPQENLLDVLTEGRDLPVPPRLKTGQQLDGFEILELLHESRATLVYKVRDLTTQQTLALKTLLPSLADDAQHCAALISEEWLAKRVLAHYFPQVLPLTSTQRHYLYYVMSYHEGATLQQHIDSGRHYAVADAAQVGIRLLKGLAALHRLNILHRDIKPNNVHIGADSKLRILDLGVALNQGFTEEPAHLVNPGTPSFMAPELFSGAGVAASAASVQSDLYAVGATLYYLLTRKYPYGEIEPFQHPHFGDPVPPTRYRPDIPQWLENILLKALTSDRKQRFETAEEFLIALERGESKPVLPPQHIPLLKRNPLRVWQSIAVIAIILNLLLIYLLVVA